MPTTSVQPDGEQGADEPLRTQAPTSVATSAAMPTTEVKRTNRQARVGREREGARRDPAVDRALDTRGAAQDLLGPVVEASGRGTDAADHLVGEPGRLPRDRVPELRARGDVVQSALRLVAGEHAVGELERPRAREGGGREALQLAAGGELGDDALEDSVADERASELLREGPASARSTTRAISGADRISSAASSSRPRQACAAARAGNKAARPAASASPERCSSSFGGSRIGQ